MISPQLRPNAVNVLYTKGLRTYFLKNFHTSELVLGGTSDDGGAFDMQTLG